MAVEFASRVLQRHDRTPGLLLTELPCALWARRVLYEHRARPSLLTSPSQARVSPFGQQSLLNILAVYAHLSKLNADCWPREGCVGDGGCGGTSYKPRYFNWKKATRTRCVLYKSSLTETNMSTASKLKQEINSWEKLCGEAQTAWALW